MKAQEKAYPLEAAGSALTGSRCRILLIAAAIAAITIIAFGGLFSASFIHMDDDLSVTDNPVIREGLSWKGIRHAFSTTLICNYIPLAQISHMLDCELYGMNAGWHHMTSVIIHTLNALLLFAFLFRTTGAAWRSAFAASLFAVHPLHVESVAWISERKDVLSTLLWFICLLAYARYAEAPSLKRYLPVFAAFLLGLLAKPMLVTLPFTLLLLDYWPLERWRPSRANGGQSHESASSGKRSAPLKRLLLEKLPLFALIPVFSMIAVSSQSEAMFPVEKLTIARRIANALVSYIAYLQKMAWPSDLSVYYPLKPHSTSLVIFSGLVLVLVTFTALWLGRNRKFLAMGWLWYLGTLVPVIGIVQVGGQAMADRYTYVPLAGIFVIISWGAAELPSIHASAKRITVASAAAALMILMVLTRIQTAYWKDGATLFDHSVKCTSENGFAHYMLGIALNEKGKTDEAAVHYSEAIRLTPGNAESHVHLGNILVKQGKMDEASHHFAEALRIDPEISEAHVNYGNILQLQGDLDEAENHFREALRIKPDNAEALVNLGDLFTKKGMAAEALGSYEKALGLNPAFPGLKSRLGASMIGLGRLPEAIRYCSEAVDDEPGSYDARCNLATALAGSGRMEEAIIQFSEAARIDPGSPQALNNLGLALSKAGRFDEAVLQYEKAVAIDPGYPDSYRNLGVAMWKQERYPEAVRYFQKVADLLPGSEQARAELQTARNALLFRDGKSGASTHHP